MSGWDSLSWEAKRGAVLAQALFVCEMCQTADANDVDHIWPRSKGGTDARWNLRAACKRCNRSKGDAVHLADLERDPDLLKFGVNHYEYLAFSSVIEAARWSAFQRIHANGATITAADDTSPPDERVTMIAYCKIAELVAELTDAVVDGVPVVEVAE